MDMMIALAAIWAISAWGIYRNMKRIHDRGYARYGRPSPPFDMMDWSFWTVFAVFGPIGYLSSVVAVIVTAHAVFGFSFWVEEVMTKLEALIALIAKEQQ